MYRIPTQTLPFVLSRLDCVEDFVLKCIEFEVPECLNREATTLRKRSHILTSLQMFLKNGLFVTGFTYTFPALASRTKKYQSFINFGLLNYQ